MWRAAAGPALVIVVVLVVLLSVAVRVRRRTANPPQPAAAALPSTADTLWDDSWPRLDVRGFPARTLDEIRAAYAFAARRPDVLQSLPCFCGCKRQGHASNEACYVRRRSAAGAPIWTDHGITCGICIDITHDAIVMTVDKRPIDEIRRSIEAKYVQQ